ncbi:hypothetical protein AGMMS49974_00270 [Deltaproteobacteria bacterium]|nr:hypothetical protein AGMMS49974_00270 [Deltaproteobacteria bacterium]
MIEIDAKGVIYYAGKAVAPEGVRGELEGLDKSTAFLLRADKEARLQRFVDVADALKQLKFARVACRRKRWANEHRGDNEPLHPDARPYAFLPVARAAPPRCGLR